MESAFTCTKEALAKALWIFDTTWLQDGKSMVFEGTQAGI